MCLIVTTSGVEVSWWSVCDDHFTPVCSTSFVTETAKESRHWALLTHTLFPGCQEIDESVREKALWRPEPACRLQVSSILPHCVRTRECVCVTALCLPFGLISQSTTSLSLLWSVCPSLMSEGCEYVQYFSAYSFEDKVIIIPHKKRNELRDK